MSSVLYQIKTEIPLKDSSKEIIRAVQHELCRLGYLGNRNVTGKIDKETLEGFCKFKKDSGLSHPYLLGKIAARLLIVKEPRMRINKIIFSQIFEKSKLSRQSEFLIPLNRALSEFDIKGIELADFLAIVNWESRHLSEIQEVSGKRYESDLSLGNNQRGDGERYKGRGLIKIVGRREYTIVGKRLGIKLRQFPTLVLDPDNASRIACYQWRAHNFKALSEQDQFKKIVCHFESRQ